MQFKMPKIDFKKYKLPKLSKKRITKKNKEMCNAYEKFPRRSFL